MADLVKEYSSATSTRHISTKNLTAMEEEGAMGGEKASLKAKIKQKEKSQGKKTGELEAKSLGLQIDAPETRPF